MRRFVKYAGIAVAVSIAAAFGPGANATSAVEEKQWNEYLRYSYFKERPIAESEDVIQLHMPEQAEDPTIVPVTVYAMIPQEESRYIRQMTLFIDNNPVPLAGRFNFSPNSGRADVSVRIRVNEATAVRAVAELSDGSLHMSKRVINASGGCSGPLPTDLESAMSRLGKMKINIGSIGFDEKPLPATLRISHPNITGMQTELSNGQFMPARFIKLVKVTYEGEAIFSAETDISISADPTFGFYIAPRESGEMIAEVTDNTGETFTKVVEVADSRTTN